MSLHATLMASDSLSRSSFVQIKLYWITFVSIWEYEKKHLDAITKVVFYPRGVTKDNLFPMNYKLETMILTIPNNVE